MALLGALAAPLCLVGALSLHPGLVFEMDRDLPARLVSGFYDVEIVGNESFAWTSDRVRVSLPGLDRGTQWRCSVRFRGGRPAGIAQPTLDIAVDGRTLVSQAASNEYQDVVVVAPPRPARGLRLTLTSSDTFEPGPGDPRALGVQVDRLACVPDAGRVPLPPVQSLVASAGSAAVFGALFGILGVGWWPSAAATLAVAILQAFPLARGLAPYTDYGETAFWLAVWIVAPASVAVLAHSWRRRAAPSPGFWFAVPFSGAILFVKLLALLHPSKALIDALFHAHRLEYVLGGRYFFTQVMPGGVQFPYAIALYVFAAPWAALTRDHVALLRIVVSASETFAGLLIYWAIARTWRDALAAAGALVLFHLVPVSYWVVGNANLTNAFGQSAAVVAMAALIVWPLGPGRWLEILGLSLLAAVGLLSHVSTFALLASTMVTTAVIYAWRGGRALLPVARSILLAVGAAVVMAVALYYGRPEFFPAYASVRAARAEAAASAAAPENAGPAGDRLAEGAIPVMSVAGRAASAVGATGDALGWPILALALLGVWRTLAEKVTGRLVWAVAGWLAASAVFLVFGVVAPGGVGHQRQAMEFIARALYAGSPGVVVLAGRGGAWAWRSRGPLRFAALGSVGLAAFAAGRTWMGWWS